MTYMRLCLCLLLILAAACTKPAEPTQPQKQEKDLQTFRLPDAVNKAAPLMRTHLFLMIQYTSQRFPIKPAFVFADGAEAGMHNLVQGRLNQKIERLNLIHMALYEAGGETPHWSGSVLNGLGNSTMLTSSKNQTIRIETSQDQIDLTVTDKDRSFKTTFHYDLDHEVWLESNGARLYVNQYVFPAALVNRGKKR